MKRQPIDPELLRDKLSVAQGKQYWRSLEELAGDPAFLETLQREFPAHAAEWAAEWVDPVSRRQFLTLMGASLALAGLSGCTSKPRETIMPYVRQPENIVLGKPLYYATTMTLGGFGTGLLVESHEGRPTKIEGNPQHPASRGATDVFAQAAVLGLYDPDRAQTVSFRERARTWGELIDELRTRLGPKTPRAKGAGVAVLTETVGSPTLVGQFEQFFTQYDAARLYRYEPVATGTAEEGARLAFNKAHHFYYRVAQADVVVSLDGDFLGSGPGHLAYSREFAARRREGGKAKDNKRGMNRLYAVESSLSITGASADHRLALPPSKVEAFARALAAKLGVAGSASTLEGEAARWVDAVAADLRYQSGRTRRLAGTTLVVTGPQQPAAVHGLVHAINAELGNLGTSVVVTGPAFGATVAGKSPGTLKQLNDDVAKGTITTLLILGGNPAYTAPADVPFAKLLEDQLLVTRDRWLAVHLSPHSDETSRLCHWHVPEAHFLESWSDAIAYDGTASLVQQLIAPLYAGRSAHELVAALCRRRNPQGETSGSDYDDRTPYDLVRDHWKTKKNLDGQAFERFWRQALHDGVIADSKLPTLPAPSLVEGLAGRIGPARPASGGYELVLAPDPTVHDGRFANLGWLQELPKPLTKLSWDNALLLSPATAEALGVGTRIGHWRGGEHGDSKCDVVKIGHAGRELEAAVWIVPGHADGAATLHLGYGRTRAGKVGNDHGFNANLLRLSTSPSLLTGVELSKVAGRTYLLACTQAHFNMQGRDPVRSSTVEKYSKHEHFGPHEHGGKVALPTLYPDEHKYPGYKWGMAIDLSACTGCSACVVACQAENNIPVVGKEQVTRGREMHWLRIDRYFETPRGEADVKDRLRVHFQPVLCMHCENAPCEVVCPVEATVHGDEGTNDMVYNRCIGTRYCSNNCPYKVRRFNFFQFSDYVTPSLKLLYNPEVTVRSRGVMEKCSFCIQRISAARIEASKEALAEPGKRVDPNRREGVAYIRDGEVVTACQAACPAEAIVFGDLGDKKNSRVYRLQESDLRYDLLGELGTRPRVVYLAAIRNPNPVLETK